MAKLRGEISPRMVLRWGQFTVWGGTAMGTWIRWGFPPTSIATPVQKGHTHYPFDLTRVLCLLLGPERRRNEAIPPTRLSATFLSFVTARRWKFLDVSTGRSRWLSQGVASLGIYSTSPKESLLRLLQPVGFDGKSWGSRRCRGVWLKTLLSRWSHY